MVLPQRAKHGLSHHLDTGDSSLTATGSQPALTLPGVNHLDIWGVMLWLKPQSGMTRWMSSLWADCGGGQEGAGREGPCSVRQTEPRLHPKPGPPRQRSQRGGNPSEENFREPHREAAPASVSEPLPFSPWKNEEQAGALEKLPSWGCT